ncbi:hypothetical protein HMPREF1210_00534 [Paenisporosarcina sp. HGH0030]|nr:hypothetical protein HMPREF1210_00534 [Paenisporosarcina sp. HGH0030]
MKWSEYEFIHSIKGDLEFLFEEGTVSTPQNILVNGAMATVNYKKGKGTITMKYI